MEWREYAAIIQSECFIGSIDLARIENARHAISTSNIQILITAFSCNFFLNCLNIDLDQ